MYIKIWDSAGAFLTELTEHIPQTAWTPNVFEGLSFESCNPGGFTVANFTIHRPITQYWSDLLYRNWVIIGEGATVFWEGYIAKPSRSIRPDTVDVACLGWSSQLNEIFTESDITAGVGGYKCSTFIVAMLANYYFGIVIGDIDTADYAYPEGTRFEFAPATFYFDAIEQLNAGNNYDWGVWTNRQFDFLPKSSDIDWLVWTHDCNDLTISPNPESLCNYVLVNYTQDGSHYQTVILSDTDSIWTYGLHQKEVDIPGQITTDGATQIATTYLAECKDLKVAAELTCSRIFDIYGVEHHLGEVRGGENIRIVDWLPTEEVISGVNDIATFQIKSAKYNNNDYTLSITPTEFLPSTEILIARLNATGY
jgi:hypothetical protein